MNDADNCADGAGSAGLDEACLLTTHSMLGECWCADRISPTILETSSICCSSTGLVYFICGIAEFGIALHFIPSL